MPVYVAFIAVLVVALLAPWPLSGVLRGRGMIDVPNARSSHQEPTIRGAGLAPLAAIVVGYMFLFARSDDRPSNALTVILAVTIFAAALGGAEDVVGVPVKLRAALQLLIGLGGAIAVVWSTHVDWWVAIIAGVAIAGYINVANFMDGVNGISGLHAIVVGAFFGVLGGLTGMTWMTESGVVLALGFAGFLPWNVIRGRMFLGDVGSYLLGGGIAIIAVEALAHGVSWLIIVAPLAVYLADSGTTLVRRVLAGDRWFEAHRTHTYQRLTDVGISHIGVALVVALATALASAVGLFVAAMPVDWPGGVAAVVLIVLVYLGLPRVIGSMRATSQLPKETSN
jgi:UDP-GlcNAc:undecaprenyl-phosphate GlcNAc-1-phosphate transferase